MWTEFIKFLSSKKDLSYKTILVHNLGGVFIFKYLCKLIKNETPSIMLDPTSLKLVYTLIL